MTTAQARHTPYPRAWNKEMHRNASGRRFWYVSRFINRTEVEFIEELGGGPRCFRREHDADAAIAKATGSAA